MRKVFIIGLILSLLWLFLQSGLVMTVSAVSAPNTALVSQVQEEKVVVYFFWGDGCPHCAKAKPVLEDYAKQHPSLDLQMFEIYNVDQNKVLFEKISELYGFEPRYVPTIFIGDRFWEGWSDEIQSDVIATIDSCLVTACPNKGASAFANTQTPSLSAYTPTPAVIITQTPGSSTGENGKTIKLPLVGKVDLSKQGLLLSTFLIALVDGFNPCSLWVLSMLLAITLHTGSRKKVLIIGLVFLTVTAAIYALFIAGLFTVLKVVSFIGWIQVVVALVALFFALVNIKDYFFYKEGVSFTISDHQKPGIYQKMRKVLDAGDSFWGLIGGTIVLAAGVSLVEFSCTAGFPVMWTNMLTAQNVSVITFVLLLLVYMFIYQLDELGVFLVAVFTLKSSKLEEKHGRILKLIGGVLMLTLAVVMLVKPALMSDIGQSLLVFGLAFLAAAIILLLHRVVLPRMGIYIGTETKKKPGKRSRK